MKDWLNANPVKARAAVVALLTVLGTVVPKLAGIETNEAIIGLLLAAAAMAGGHSAGKRVVTHETDAARTEEARTAALAEGCTCPDADTGPRVRLGDDGMKAKR